MTVQTENATDTTLVTTTEAVVATLTGISVSGPGKNIRLKGSAKITTGTNTTAVNLRIRRDSLTGTEICESNPAQIESAAGNTEDHDIAGVDSPSGEIFNATYVLTAQLTAATANGACVYAYLEAECE
jgi:hypothetical protein